MHIVTPAALFRMSFILQDSSATTTATYLTKIVESELYATNKYLSVNEISENISRDLSLEFSDLEIINAIKRSKNLICDGNKKYSLSPERMSVLACSKTIEQRLDGFVKRFIHTREETDFTDQRFSELFSKFLYHCFNTNKDALLLIIDDEEKTAERAHFEASNEEREIINDFLMWDNEEKDKLIYQVVSTCYAYCSLTAKKDALLSAEIFRNKRFYLDANIIFRMAGINKSERQRTVTSFVKNCKTHGIQLLYTSSTYDEIVRVIENKCSWLKSVTGNGRPIDLSEWEHHEDDFYEIYRSWCHEPGNKYGDFTAFSSYLHRLVNTVLSELKLENIPNYRLRRGEEFTNSCEALASYKKRVHTQQSLETDINNLFHLIERRRGEDTASIFSTSTYMISADQSFISFATDYVAGVQIVVLPSVWLTIMLRFCGRTEDDYKAFVSFMSIRSNESTTWDIYGVLEKLNDYTSNEDIKRKVITEMQQHRDTYPVDDEDEYNESIKKAFDTIIEDDRIKQKAELENKVAEMEAGFSALIKKNSEADLRAREELEEKHRKEQEEAIQTAERNAAIKERISGAELLAEKKAQRVVKLWTWANRVRRIITYALLFAAIICFFGWLFEIKPIEGILETLTPAKLKDNFDGKYNFFSGVIWGGFAWLSTRLKNAIEGQYSDERCKRIIEDEKARLLKELSENDEPNKAA